MTPHVTRGLPDDGGCLTCVECDLPPNHRGPCDCGHVRGTPRDPQRIDVTMAVLSAAWKANPDWRLGQLVYNAARSQRSIPPCPELFYMKDEEIALGLDETRAMG